MESLRGLFKSLSDALGVAQQQNAGENVQHSPLETNNTRQARLRAINNQAREDDDEEFEVRGRRHKGAGNGINPSGIGLAALAIGGVIGTTYLANNYFSKEPKLSITQEQILKKLEKIEEDSKEYPVVGFDCQWSIQLDGNKRSKIALLQISSHKENVLLIQINKLYTFPGELINFLRNPKLIKAGLETLKDARYLLEDYGLVVKGTFDLRFLAEDTGHRPESLAKMAHKILDIEIGRDWDLIASDWNKDKLDDSQLDYAEKAAKASVDIFKSLIHFAIHEVNRNEILSYCSENMDRTFIFYSQDY